MFPFVLLLLSISCAGSFVIAPPWANHVVNPCSTKSWQLVYWPKDKKCYQIFEQGPCPPTQELSYNSVTKAPECRCPKNLLYWPETDRCYPEYGKGPCEINHYLEQIGGKVQCVNTQRCENGWVYWPSEEVCYELYTQGPCHKGDLLILNPHTAEPFCGCDPLLLRQYYFTPLRLCYEHYTRGPCEAGLLFAYNHTSDATQCICQPGMANYHEGRCYQFGIKGPCSKGQIFQYSETSGRGECKCKDNYVFWPANGECYRAFTPGPCRPSQFLVPDERGHGRCARNPCPRAHLYFPESELTCHKVGSRGPCPLGQLVVFEKYSGKSFRGECGCSEGYNQNYWPENGQCYEWYSQGPCPESFLFKYNKPSGRTECVCDEESGYVFWNETSQCYRLYTQGPCPKDAWLIPGEESSDVYCECKTGFYFAPESYSCEKAPVIETIGLLSYLRKTSPTGAEEVPPRTQVAPPRTQGAPPRTQRASAKAERTRATSRYGGVFSSATLRRRREKVETGGRSRSRTRYAPTMKEEVPTTTTTPRPPSRGRVQPPRRAHAFEGIFVRPGHTGTAKRNGVVGGSTEVGGGTEYTWLGPRRTTEEEVLPAPSPLRMTVGK